MALQQRQYTKWIVELKQNIQLQKMQTTLLVNKNLLILYWYIGKQIETKIEQQGWGTKVIEQLSIDLQKAFPEMKGFSVRNLSYMKRFAEAYPDLLIMQPVVAELQKPTKINKKSIMQPVVAELQKQTKTNKNLIMQPVVAEFNKQPFVAQNPLLISITWTHHIMIVERCNNADERNWYTQKIVNEGWSKNVLKYHLDSDLYNRLHGKKQNNNFNATLPKPHSDLANEIFKDPYKFEFLQLGTSFSEKELEESLVNHIKSFLVELGVGFAFVGQQYKLTYNNRNKYVDLLFYHLHLRSYILIELKLDDFEAAHAGQMNAYINMADKTLRHKHDNPSIGIILCGGKDTIEVDFALGNLSNPIGVSEYKYVQNQTKQIMSALPTAKQLKLEVKRFLQKNKNTMQ